MTDEATAERKRQADAQKQAQAANDTHLAETDARRAQVHARSGDRTETLEDAQKKGFLGEKVDPAPDSAYTHPAHKG